MEVLLIGAAIVLLLVFGPGRPPPPAALTVSGPGGAVSITPPVVTTTPNVVPVPAALTPGIGEAYAPAPDGTVWPGAPSGWQPRPTPAWLAPFGVRGYLAPGAISPGGTTQADSRAMFPEFANPKDRTWIFNHLDPANANRGGQPYAYVSGTTEMLAWYERKDKTGGGGLKKLFGGGSPLSGLLSLVQGANPLGGLMPKIAVASPIRV